MVVPYVAEPVRIRPNVERGRKGNVCDVHETALIFESHPPAGFSSYSSTSALPPPLDAE